MAVWECGGWYIYVAMTLHCVGLMQQRVWSEPDVKGNESEVCEEGGIDIFETALCFVVCGCTLTCQQFQVILLL